MTELGIKIEKAVNGYILTLPNQEPEVEVFVFKDWKELTAFMQENESPLFNKESADGKAQKGKDKKERKWDEDSSTSEELPF